MSYFPKPGDFFEERFEILEHVASGGFSRIYRARQRGLERDVALKVLRPVRSADGGLDSARWQEWSRRFEREARLVSQLKDPHTVTVHDFGEGARGMCYIVFEFIDGETLGDRHRRERFSPAQVVDILGQTLQSLAEAHQLGVLHRDIKPANIMLYEHLGKADCVKLLDFGIAQSAVDTADRTVEDLTREGHILGTPRYMSPEQLRNRDLSPASDLYSLGLVAWEMLVGHPAITGSDTMAIISRQVDADPFDLPGELDAPGWLQRVVERMVRKDPAERYQSAEEVLEALDAADPGPTVAREATRGAASSAVIDPNVTDAEAASAASDADVDAAASALAEDYQRQAREQAGAAAEVNATTEMSAPPVETRPSPAEQPTMQLDAGAPKPEASPAKRLANAADGKVSELTMLGAEEMLRRGERGGDRRRRLGCIVGALAVLGLLGAAGYYLYGKAGSLSAIPDTVGQMAEREVVHPVSDTIAGDSDRYSIEGLKLAIRGADWAPQGTESAVQTTEAIKLEQTYAHGDMRVDVIIHDREDRAAARNLAEAVELPARALLFDTKVVVLEPATPDDNQAAEGLAMFLANYRDKVVEADD